MTIDFTKKFVKQYKKLRPAEQRRFQQRLKWFETNQYDPRLRNHALKGAYRGLHSIDVGGDLRALYIEKDDKLILFALIGTHSQLYG